jgi:hypothetical protein
MNGRSQKPEQTPANMAPSSLKKPSKIMRHTDNINCEGEYRQSQIGAQHFPSQFMSFLGPSPLASIQKSTLKITDFFPS